MAEYKLRLKSKLKPGNHTLRLSIVKKTIESFDCKINGQALVAKLKSSLGRLDRGA